MEKTNNEHVAVVQAEREVSSGADRTAAQPISDGERRRRGIKLTAAKRAETAIFEQPAVEAPGETPAKNDSVDQRKTRRNPTARKKDKAVGAENAAVLLSLLDGLAVMVIGEEARMNEFERLLIAEPLERIMARLEWQTGEAVNRWMDPILLVIGLVTWGSRLVQVYTEQHSKRQKPDDGLYGPKQQPQQQSNGNAPAAPAVQDLGVLTNPGLEIGRDAERVRVAVERMR